MFKKIILSSHDRQPIFIIRGNTLGKNVFLFNVHSGNCDFDIFNFTYNEEDGVQPNGDYDTGSGFFYINYTELNLLIGRYKDGVEIL